MTSVMSSIAGHPQISYPGVAAGKLGYQACNNKMCFPPKSVEISVPYQVQ